MSRWVSFCQTNEIILICHSHNDYVSISGGPEVAIGAGLAQIGVVLDILLKVPLPLLHPFHRTTRVLVQLQDLLGGPGGLGPGSL